MDITLLQIQNGSYIDLMYFKKEIISYLSDKKFSTKSITLVKTLKMIDKEIIRRKNGKICRQSECSFQVSANSTLNSKGKNLAFPEFLNEIPPKVEFLNNKRGLEKYISENPHLISRVATYICSKDQKVSKQVNSTCVSYKGEFDITFERSLPEDEVESISNEENKSNCSIKISDKEKLENELNFERNEYLIGSFNLSKEAAFTSMEYDKYSNKNSFSHRTRSTDENSCFNHTLLEEDYLVKNLKYSGLKMKKDFLSEKIDDVHVDLFFG